MEEGKAARELTRQDPIRFLQELPAKRSSASSKSGLILALSVAALLILSILYAFKNHSFTPVRSGICDPITDVEGMKPFASPEGSPVEAAKSVPDASHAEVRVFDVIAFHERLSGFVKSLRSCMNDVAAERQSELRKVIRQMERNTDENAWQALEMRFKGAYEGFVEKLRDLVPGLTRNERRLCLFVRMDMTTKEISNPDRTEHTGRRVGAHKTPEEAQSHPLRNRLKRVSQFPLISLLNRVDSPSPSEIR